MGIYAVAIFAGAFLLFELQPLVGKYILPWFGGGPAVWTCAMLFFQVLLLGGYAYAHWIVRRLEPRAQVSVHLLLTVVAVALLPIEPSARWKPDSGGSPTLQIVQLLTVSIGLPYFVLASTSPLMQGWFSRLHPAVSPYRLYALSNLGSLLALLSYPFLVEPALGRTTQVKLWSWGFGLFAAASALCAARLWRHRTAATGPVHAAAAPRAEAPRPRVLARLLWVGLPAAASVLLLAVTNQITQDVAVIPFLWVAPLSFYLLSFVITFDHPRWYRRGVFASGLAVAVAVILWLLFRPGASIPMQIGLYLAALFICCMAAHGELARLRPDPRYLTSFYLLIAAGGALGGVFVAIVAPLLFTSFLELQLGIFVCCGLVLVAAAADPRSGLRRGRRAWARIPLGLGVAGLGLIVGWAIRADRSPHSAVLKSRNFYGVVRVIRADAHSAHERLVLYDGNMAHGFQLIDPDKRRWPTMWYSEVSGVGLVFRHFPRKVRRQVGLVGLGTGTVASYGRPGDRFRFYEINPEVVRVAETYFTYLADSRARVELVLGDARLSLERESPQGFNILVLDAFRSDAIPVHLLTKEAFEIYDRHLEPDGVIAVHLTNLSFDLQPVLRRLAAHLDLEAIAVVSGGTPRGGAPAEWMLLTRNQKFLESEGIRRIRRSAVRAGSTAGAPGAQRIDQGVALWTDDYANLFAALK